MPMLVASAEQALTNTQRRDARSRERERSQQELRERERAAAATIAMNPRVLGKHAHVLSTKA